MKFYNSFPFFTIAMMRIKDSVIIEYNFLAKYSHRVNTIDLSKHAHISPMPVSRLLELLTLSPSLVFALSLVIES